MGEYIYLPQPMVHSVQPSFPDIKTLSLQLTLIHSYVRLHDLAKNIASDSHTVWCLANWHCCCLRNRIWFSTCFIGISYVGDMQGVLIKVDKPGIQVT